MWRCPTQSKDKTNKQNVYSFTDELIKTKCARKWLENVHNTPESRQALIEKYKEWNVNEDMPEQIYSENEETNEHRVIEEEKKVVPVHKQDLFKGLPARAKANSQPPCSAKVNISHLSREHKNIATYD